MMFFFVNTQNLQNNDGNKMIMFHILLEKNSDTYVRYLKKEKHIYVPYSTV